MSEVSEDIQSIGESIHEDISEMPGAASGTRYSTTFEDEDEDENDSEDKESSYTQSVASSSSSSSFSSSTRTTLTDTRSSSSVKSQRKSASKANYSASNASARMYEETFESLTRSSGSFSTKSSSTKSSSDYSTATYSSSSSSKSTLKSSNASTSSTTSKRYTNTPSKKSDFVAKENTPSNTRVIQFHMKNPQQQNPTPASWDRLLQDSLRSRTLDEACVRRPSSNMFSDPILSQHEIKAKYPWLRESKLAEERKVMPQHPVEYVSLDDEDTTEQIAYIQPKTRPVYKQTAFSDEIEFERDEQTCGFREESDILTDSSNVRPEVRHQTSILYDRLQEAIKQDCRDAERFRKQQMSKQTGNGDLADDSVSIPASLSGHMQISDECITDIVLELLRSRSGEIIESANHKAQSTAAINHQYRSTQGITTSVQNQFGGVFAKDEIQQMIEQQVGQLLAKPRIRQAIQESAYRRLGKFE